MQLLRALILVPGFFIIQYIRRITICYLSYMRFHFSSVRALLISAVLLVSLNVQAQKQEKSYNSLLWEITGNGLKKPSYLFGTMHISNKMVFNLSDSFYAAIRNSDIVAIELNPESWQSEIPRINKQSEIYRYYNAVYYTDFLKENSFREGSFIEQLQESLRFEPPLNDQLLYRNDRGMDNFQEDTYLDLYIYQTGKKLGKKATGVETFMGSQRMMIEAYVDMANDKNKKRYNDEVKYYELGQQMQDAYRRGDLDMLDSINKMTEYSESFTEKFLYKRNDMQAGSMDSIMQTQSLFVGVGAAHLPGKRGVIEILRKKGYTLRPVYMQNRDAVQKKYIDSLTVPVNFVTQYAPDSFYKVAVPGKLNDIESKTISLKHYADMANGSYYLITRIRTNTLFNGYSEQKTVKLIDSLLYENIPGSILSKKNITRNGYEGWDIINKTKKNELQHYQILVTPVEILIFKMGGIGNYVSGKEAETFFGSITLKERPTKSTWQSYTPPSGGFTIKMPAAPQVYYTYKGADNLPEWKYEVVDPLSGEHYSIFKKSIYSFDFIESDTFDLSLITASFCSSPEFDKTISRKISYIKGKPVMDVVLKAKNGDHVQARAILQGPQYYLLAHRSVNKNQDAATFFNSFTATAYQYPEAQLYTDSNFNFTVNTPVKPVLDADVLDMMGYVKQNEKIIKSRAGYNPIAENNFANFVSEETGEVIVVNAYKYPEYFYVQDSAAFMNARFLADSSLVCYRKTKLTKGEGTTAWLLEFSDTGSSRLIKKLLLLRGNTMVTAHTMVDTTLPESTFIRSFYESLDIHGVAPEADIFTSKLDRYLKDYNSTDTLVSKRAKAALSSVYFDKKGFTAIMSEMQKLKAGDKDYFELKNKFIIELGYIKDSSITAEVAAALKNIYIAAGDTAMFQNSALLSLSRLHSAPSTAIFKTLLIQDPPAFEDRYEYTSLLGAYNDSLKLAAELFPELLTLTMIEDFKQPVRELLATLVDSGYIKPGVYEDYTGNIYFDAKLALKKLQTIDEGSFGKSRDKDEEEQDSPAVDNELANNLATFTTLLLPYYDTNPNLPKFFDKLLQAKNPIVKMNTALALLKAKKRVADSTWSHIAVHKEYRAQLWAGLKQQKRQDLFPAPYKTDEMLAAAAIYANGRIDSLVLLQKKQIRFEGKDALVYCFKYKLRKNDGWKIAISGLLPDKQGLPENCDALSALTSKTLDKTKTVAEQLSELLTQLLISRKASGRQFYQNEYGSNVFQAPRSRDSYLFAQP